MECQLYLYKKREREREKREEGKKSPNWSRRSNWSTCLNHRQRDSEPGIGKITPPRNRLCRSRLSWEWFLDSKGGYARDKLIMLLNVNLFNVSITHGEYANWPRSAGNAGMIGGGTRSSTGNERVKYWFNQSESFKTDGSVLFARSLRPIHYSARLSCRCPLFSNCFATREVHFDILWLSF